MACPTSFFPIANQDALIKDGWTILYDRQDVSFTAHFTQNGRNLWATHLKGECNEIRVRTWPTLSPTPYRDIVVEANQRFACHAASWTMKRLPTERNRIGRVARL